MGWATRHIDRLKKGETITIKAPRGNSMRPKVMPGDIVTIEPAKEVAEGDIVLCKVGKSQYIHLVTAVQGERYQISNNHGHVNGWVGKNGIFGKVIRVGS